MVDVGGVGYRASTSGNTLRALPPIGEECVLHTRMVVREDAMLLFGFAERGERAAFDSLTAVHEDGSNAVVANWFQWSYSVGADLGYYALSSREEFDVLLATFLDGAGPGWTPMRPRTQRG